MSSATIPIGGAIGLGIYRLVSPAVIADASGGVVEVDANSKFNTNIPLDRYMLIRQVDWYLTITKLPAFLAGAALMVWHHEWQLTEALARTATTFTDAVYVDEGLVEEVVKSAQATAASEQVNQNDRRVYPIRRVLFTPWATAAQQLNIVYSSKPFQAVGTFTAGPKASLSAVIEYELLPLTMDIRNYLATRVQIGGQA
jgi:hypothetical protein